MTEKKDSRPFDLKAAKAGAPLMARDSPIRVEFVAQVEKAAPNQCLVFLWGQQITVRGVDALYSNMAYRGPGDCEHPNDILMAPLGWIDRKPVFVGDAIISESHQPYIVHAGHEYDWAKYSWPAPAVVYPETLMSGQDLHDAYTNCKSPDIKCSFKAAGNAAIRHAIDAGQVVTKEAHDAAVKDALMRFNPYTESAINAKNQHNAKLFGVFCQGKGKPK